MKRTTLWVGFAALVAVTAGASVCWAGQRVIAGVDLGLASPNDRFRDHAQNGGVFSPFVAYMFTDYLGAVGQAQALGFPVANASPSHDNDTWAIAGLVGPRVAVPLQFGSTPSELYGTWEGGVFTGLNAHTPISRTSWGYSTGGGFNLGVTQSLMAGLFMRFNTVDQSVDARRVRYFSTGLGLTYHIPVGH